MGVIGSWKYRDTGAESRAAEWAETFNSGPNDVLAAYKMLKAQEIEDFPYPSPPTNPCLEIEDTRYWVSQYGFNSIHQFCSDPWSRKDYYIYDYKNFRGYRFKTLHCVGSGWNDFPSDLDVDYLKVVGCETITFHYLMGGAIEAELVVQI
jgi:hypothetical protein